MFDSTYSVPPPESASNRNFHMDTSNSNDRSALDSFVRQSLSSQGGNNSITSMIGLEPLSPVSSTSAFLLGIHNYKALDDVNLPDFVKEHQATLTFPEKLMLMLAYVDKENKRSGGDPEKLCISWILDGRAFIIRSKEEMAKQLLPMFFRQSKFPSFTRKLYRWGFRQVSVVQHSSTNRRDMIFGHEFFQRDNKALMGRMRSVTAAGTRRAVQARTTKLVGQRTETLAIEPKSALVTQLASCPRVAVEQTAPKDLGDSQCLSMHMVAPTLQDAMQFTNQQRTLHVQQYAVIQSTVNNTCLASTNEVADGKQATNRRDSSITQGGLPMATQPMDCPFSNFASFALPNAAATIAAAQERMRNHHEGGSDSTDPNGYMRAAVDLLLRYAS